MNVSKKTELLVTAKDIEEMNLLIDAGADALLIGGGIYGLRARGNFTSEKIKQAANIAKEKEKKLYVMMNALFHNDMLIGLEEFISTISDYKIDAIVFEDPAIFTLAKKINPNIPLHLSSGTMITNSYMINFWTNKGISRAELARELSLDEVMGIKKNVEIEIQIQVHGMTSIFHSKRKLLTSYLRHIERDNIEELINDELFLREHERPDNRYPVIEDNHGTHIMNDQEICMIDYIPQIIDAKIDSIKIEGILHSTEYLIKVTKIYRKAIDKAYNGESIDGLYEQIKAIQPKNRPLNTGFYFKEQIYPDMIISPLE